MFERPVRVLLCGLTALWVLACSNDEFLMSQDRATTGGSGASGGEAHAGGAAGAAGDPTADSGGSGGSGGGGGSGGSGGSVPAVPEPLLSDLYVEGVRVGLKPAFAPERVLYSALAEDASSTPIVTASADEELNITIDGISVESGEPLTLDERLPGEDIEIEVANSEGDTELYEVRYLPHDFPDIRIDISEAGASEDPIYVAMRRAGVYYLAKLDSQGVPLFYRQWPRAIFDFKKQPTGNLSFAQRTGVSIISEHVVLDEEFEEVERVSTVDLTHTDEHEFLMLPNGNYIVLAYERTRHDLTEFGLTDNELIVDAILQELSPEREVVFQWNSWDHMIYGESQYLERNYQDYSHINSVEILPDGNWLLSSRGMSQLLKVDRETGEVIWRLGGVQNDFRFIDDPYGGLCGQHTARWLGNGHILLFDNGQYCWPQVEDERGEYTRVVEYEVDETKMTARLVWSFHRDGAYTFTQGSSQRLPNGNTFVGWGGGPVQMATEVDPFGNVVFEFSAIAADGGDFDSYRAYRFPD